MSESKHTPGPWIFSEARTVEGEAMVLGGEGQDFGLVAVVTIDADARLIAASPELLTSLRWALPLARIALQNHRLFRLQAGHHDIGAKRGTDIGLWDDEVNSRNAAEAAIAKATTTQPTESQFQQGDGE